MGNSRLCCGSIIIIIICLVIGMIAASAIGGLLSLFPGESYDDETIIVENLSTGIIRHKTTYDGYNEYAVYGNVKSNISGVAFVIMYYENGTVCDIGYNYVYPVNFGNLVSGFHYGDPKISKVNVLVYKQKNENQNLTELLNDLNKKLHNNKEALNKYNDQLVLNKTIDFDMSNIVYKDETTSSTSSSSSSSSTSSTSSQTRFNKLDRNHDGKLSISEFEDYGEYIMEDSFWKGYSIEEAVQSEFDNLDTNNDGYLSYKEFSRRY